MDLIKDVLCKVACCQYDLVLVLLCEADDFLKRVDWLKGLNVRRQHETVSRFNAKALPRFWQHPHRISNTFFGADQRGFLEGISETVRTLQKHFNRRNSVAESVLNSFPPKTARSG